MAKWEFEVSNEKAVSEAFAESYGYQAKVQEAGDGDELKFVKNKQSQVEFAKAQVADFISRTVLGHEVIKARAKTLEDAAKAADKITVKH